ncbi:hypothetical protein EG68_06120 [Paragonimus skrjabini miyazakii]|uniref:Amino acid transporter transmembrane domain-containing protein n=1 Tax=Paragonimus skrjabini miyazakii TaxID=59628 RepID=A0A8S9YN88_9TREM|nr:hypothetical protein EG68_06120 [Paragonimus skrjabini miyazakii]
MTDSEKTSITKNEHLPANTSDNSSIHSADEDGENIMLQTHDPHVMGDHLKESQALMNFIKGNIGTGMLSMPVVLRYAGLWTGFFMILIAGSMAAYLMKVLVRTSRSVREQHSLDRAKMDYTETVFYVFKYGPMRLRKPKGKIKHTVNLFLIVTQIGFSCVYTLFITENIRYFIHGFFPHLSISFYLVAFLVCLALTPMCLCSDMRVFARISAVANVATLLGSILIFIYLFTSGLQPLDSLPVITNPQGILVAFGIVMFSFEGISLVLPIESKMENPDSYIHPCGVLSVGMIIIITLNVAFGFFGFMRFGEDAKGTITLNIPEYPYWFSPVKPLFIIAIMVTYLLQFYIPASIFSRLMEKLRCHREASDRRRYINLKLMRIGLVMFSYLMVVTIPKLDLMISLIGAFASSMLAFILPPVLELVHLWERRNEIRGFWVFVFAKHLFFILVGLISFVGGTVATLIQLIEAFEKPEQPL